jgi:hypothetical protein
MKKIEKRILNFENMNKIKENNLYLRILKFWEAHPEWFTYKQIESVLSPKDWEDRIIQEYLLNAVKNSKFFDSIYWGNYKDTVFFMLERQDDIRNRADPIEYLSKSTFIIKYDAFFNYIDYLELQKAIENSKQASIQAKIAIYVAVGLWVIQIIVWIIQIYLTK